MVLSFYTVRCPGMFIRSFEVNYSSFQENTEGFQCFGSSSSKFKTLAAVTDFYNFNK